MGVSDDKRHFHGLKSGNSGEIVYGRQVVREIVKQGKARAVYFSEDSRGSAVDEIKEIARQNKIRLKSLTGGQFKKLVNDAEGNQGVAALVPVFNYLSLRELVSLVGDEADVTSKALPLLLMLDHIEDPRNLGSVIRTAHAAGVQGIIIPKSRAAHVTPVVRKTAAGSAECIPIAIVSNLVQAINIFKEKGYWIYGIEADASVNYYSADYSRPLIIVAGSEGKGLTRLVRDNCDQILAIPMPGGGSSLNISVACAIVIYESISRREKWIRST